MKYLEVVSSYLIAIGRREEDAAPVGSLDCHHFADEVNHKTGMEKTMIHLALDGIGDFSEVARAHIEEVTGVSVGNEPTDEASIAEAAARRATADEAAEAEANRVAEAATAEADAASALAAADEADRVKVAEAFAAAEREADEAAEAEANRVAAGTADEA